MIPVVYEQLKSGHTVQLYQVSLIIYKSFDLSYCGV